MKHYTIKKHKLDRSLVIRDQTREFIVGKILGYPDCCIKDWIGNGTLILATERTREQIEANNGTGFMPCIKHAKQIVNKEITIESLITNRTHPVAFPNTNTELLFHQIVSHHE